MNDPAERVGRDHPGTGCVGIAFHEREQTTAIMQRDWGTRPLPGTELAKVDKPLKWIVPTPIPDPDVGRPPLAPPRGRRRRRRSKTPLPPWPVEL